MDSPRGRIYQMVQVANGAPITPSYIEHIDLCLACRGCESACPSGVPYGRMVEDGRAEIEAQRRRNWLGEWARRLVFSRVLPSRTALSAAGAALYMCQATGLKALTRSLAGLKMLGRLGDLANL